MFDHVVKKYRQRIDGLEERISILEDGERSKAVDVLQQRISALEELGFRVQELGSKINVLEKGAVPENGADQSGEFRACTKYRVEAELAQAAAITRGLTANLPRHDESVFEDATFTRDWFIERAAWGHFFAKDRSNVREYLEIGSFEGRSTLYAANLFPNATLTCIDTFEGGGAHNEYLDELFANLEERFLRNIAPIRDRVNVLKGTSVKRLAELSDNAETFDVIYIDGCHFYRHVMLDTLMTWPLLKVGGILIWDDYDFAMAQYGDRVPRLATNQFLDAYAGDYELIFVTNQVAVRKTRPEPAVE